VRVSGEVLIDKRKVWLTVGTADNMQCSPIEVEVPGDGPTTPEDVAVALGKLFDSVRDVIVGKIRELHEAVQENTGGVKL